MANNSDKNEEINLYFNSDEEVNPEKCILVKKYTIEHTLSTDSKYKFMASVNYFDEAENYLFLLKEKSLRVYRCEGKVFKLKSFVLDVES